MLEARGGWLVLRLKFEVKVDFVVLQDVLGILPIGENKDVFVVGNSRKII